MTAHRNIQCNLDISYEGKVTVSSHMREMFRLTFDFPFGVVRRGSETEQGVMARLRIVCSRVTLILCKFTCRVKFGYNVKKVLFIKECRYNRGAFCYG